MLSLGQSRASNRIVEVNAVVRKSSIVRQRTANVALTHPWNDSHQLPTLQCYSTFYRQAYCYGLRFSFFANSWLTIHRSADLLKDEFLNVPARHITNVLKQHKTLFKAYLVLEGQVRNYQRITAAFARPPRPRNKRGTELILIERGSQLPKELRAAKKKLENQEGKCGFLQGFPIISTELHTDETSETTQSRRARAS